MNLPVNAALARYGAVKVTTANPGNLLVMLYEGLIRFLREAQTAMAANDRARAGERLSRSQAIIRPPAREPRFAARAPALPEPAGPLRVLHRSSAQGQPQQDPEKIGEVVRLLTPLRDAWSTAVAQVLRAAPVGVAWHE